MGGGRLSPRLVTDPLKLPFARPKRLPRPYAWHGLGLGTRHRPVAMALGVLQPRQRPLASFEAADGHLWHRHRGEGPRLCRRFSASAEADWLAGFGRSKWARFVVRAAKHG